LEIIESKKEFESFWTKYHSSEEGPIIYYVFSDIHLHPLHNRISFLCVRLDDDYILPFNHNDALNLPIENLYRLQTENKKYVWNKKNLLHQVDFKNMIDISTLLYLETNKDYNDIDEDDNYISFWNYKFPNQKNLNDYIPLLKHYEYIKKHMDNNIFNKKFINSRYDYMTRILYTIEKNGMLKNDQLVYTQYNNFTSTGRPSNRFGGTNFAALNKTDGSRKPYISRFGSKGKLVEFDYDAYHLRLIADKVGYEFSDASVHQHFADLFDITYQEAKVLSFQYLYGYIPDEIAENIKYFDKVRKYTDQLWKDFKSKDFIESDIYKRQIKGNDFNANKLFNYYIQLLETESNVLVIKDVRKLMGKYKSKLVLYSYDSFLFDMHIDDGLPLLTEIKEVLERGKYPVKAAWGNNYDELADITEKF
tara:strand:- start:387 stop:1646 length:1260 start_codon:yes stop_codon:yes gene_type:complete